MRTVLCAVEVDHAVEAGEGGAATLVTMGVELLLRQDIAAVLAGGLDVSTKCEVAWFDGARIGMSMARDSDSTKR